MSDEDNAEYLAFMGEMSELTQQPPLIAELSMVEAWSLLAAVQLACRHPAFIGPTRKIAERCARELQAWIATSPALAVVAERGWHEQYDEPERERERERGAEPA